MAAPATALTPETSHLARPAGPRQATLADMAVATICIAAFVLYLLGIVLLLGSTTSPGGHDFIAFWAAGQQLIHHANPYDAANVLRTEITGGFKADSHALIMRNPPWAACLVLPLGLLGAKAGSLVWAGVLLACLVASVRLFSHLLGRPNDPLHLLAFAFNPGLLCILAEQTSLFALLGLVLFLRWHRLRPFAAGLALYLCALKPHLFLPFAAALVLWVVATRSYRILVGFGLALAAASAGATWCDPGIWAHYRQMMQHSGISTEFIPCLAVALRFAVHRQTMWLQFVPAGLGCVWAVWYFLRHHGRWDWMEHGAMLLAVSLTVSPYSWWTDQAVVLPALMLATARWASPLHIRFLMLASAAMAIQQLCGATLHSPWVLWTAPFWLAWYLSVATGKRSVEMLSQMPQPAG